MTQRAKLVLVLLGIALAMLAAPRLGATADIKPEAQAAIDSGLAAAKRQAYQEALRDFLAAQKIEPRVPAIWFDLGLAASRIPGYELPALAWLRLYLEAMPGAANAADIRTLMTTLAHGFVAKIDVTSRQFETLLASLASISKPSDLHVMTDQVAAAYNFVGDSADALRVLRARRGDGWEQSMADEPLPALAESFASLDMLDEARASYAGYDPEVFYYFLERRAFVHAQAYAALNPDPTEVLYGWFILACAAEDKDQAMLSWALAQLPPAKIPPALAADVVGFLTGLGQKDVAERRAAQIADNEQHDRAKALLDGSQPFSNCNHWFVRDGRINQFLDEAVSLSQDDAGQSRDPEAILRTEVELLSGAVGTGEGVGYRAMMAVADLADLYRKIAGPEPRN